MVGKARIFKKEILRMKKNAKNRLRELGKEELVNRYNYLKSKMKVNKKSNMMKYIEYHLRKRFDTEI